MIKLNDENIFVGKIKQLLHTFNLPNCSIYTEDSKDNLSTTYIKDGAIYSTLIKEDERGIKNSVQVRQETYLFNKKYLNLTSNLPLDNNIYDSFTHRYLGKYLRFIRDYAHINLMSLYNCFDEKIYDKSLILDIDKKTRKEFVNSSSYAIFEIPVAYTKYTLKFDCPFPLEGFLDLGKNVEADEMNIKTYFKLNCSLPTILDINELFKKIDSTQFTKANCRDNLKLILKLPINYTKKLVILEGNFKRNFANRESLINSPSLLSNLNSQNYLLADKIIEYLTGNVITNLSESYDIVKLQEFLIKNDLLDYETYFGIWSKKDSEAIINFIIKNKLYESNYDLLPFMDSVVEEAFLTKVKNKGGLI